jgi:DNA-binding response OmpR family regulator
VTDTILIADDDVSHRDLLEGILTGVGYDVRQAVDGRAALADALGSPPDLILLDLRMPGMNGLEVCRQLKVRPATAAVPVIVVTSAGEITAKEQALASGADDFVRKPVDAQDLRSRVQAILKVRGIRRELDRTLAYLHELETGRRTQRREAMASLGLAVQAPELHAAIPVLLVDDDTLMRAFYGDLLSEHGFRPILAGNGPEAIALAQQEPVEAVLLDLLMPEMSGLEVLERFRVLDPDLPVVMLTACASSRNAVAALKLGAFDFIVKGLDHDLVILAIHRAVRHRRDTLSTRRELERLRGQIAELQARRPGP